MKAISERSVKTLLLVLIVAGIVAMNFGPSVKATWDYALRPHSIHCRTFSLRVPLNWKLDGGDCSFIDIEKRRNLVPATDVGAAELFISPFPAADLAREEKEFIDAYSRDWHLSKMSFGNAVNNCDWAELDGSPGWVTVICWDIARGIKFRFTGAESNFDEAVNLIS